MAERSGRLRGDMEQRLEHRSLKGTVETRQGPNGPMICGYGAVFNRDSSDLGFIERVDPGAFAKTLTEADVRGLGNHDPNWLLGRAKAGTLRLRTDSTGLWYEIDVNQSDPDGQRALAKVQRGDWDASSFSFTTVRDEWNWQTNPPQRRLLEVGLIDVSPVTFPAYPDATATARALAPIAAKVGQPVDTLVNALARGEIRSLIENGGTMTDTDVEERDVWTTTYINNLPDSSFLYVEDGGEKDSDGKTTPRSLRHFPVKDASGNVDLPHLRNALARIPQSSLPQSVKDEAQAKAEKMLAAATGKNSADDETVELRDLLEELCGEVESRAGKVLSSKNATILQGVADQIRELLAQAMGETTDTEDEGTEGPDNLLDVAKDGAPADSQIGDWLDSESNSLTLLAAEAEMRRRTVLADIAA